MKTERGKRNGEGQGEGGKHDKQTATPKGGCCELIIDK